MSCCRDAYRSAQRAHGDHLPEDPEEVAEKAGRKQARDEQRIEDYVFEQE